MIEGVRPPRAPPSVGGMVRTRTVCPSPHRLWSGIRDETKGVRGKSLRLHHASPLNHSPA